MDSRVVKILTITSGVVAGGLTGYLIGTKLASKKYEAIIEKEISDVREYYKKVYKEGEYASPESAHKAFEKSRQAEKQEVPTSAPTDKLINDLYDKKLSELGYSEGEQTEGTLYNADTEPDEEPEDEDESEEVETTTVVNIFNNPVTHDIDGNELPEYKEDAFFADRDEKDIHLISVDEFMEDEEYDKITVSYFEDDETLCDENEHVIVDIARVIGNEALSNFGNHADDKNTVYVRNPKNETDYEVYREEGKYSVRVLGLREEDDKRPKKMRDDE